MLQDVWICFAGASEKRKTILTLMALLMSTGCAPHARQYSAPAFTNAEYGKINHLTDIVLAGGHLSETDVDGLLLSVGKLPTNNVPNLVQRHTIGIATVFVNASRNQLPASRLSQIYHLGVQMATAHDANTLPIYIWRGCEILGNLGDPNAIPVLRQCMSSSNPNTRSHAQKALLKISGG